MSQPFVAKMFVLCLRGTPKVGPAPVMQVGIANSLLLEGCAEVHSPNLTWNYPTATTALVKGDAVLCGTLEVGMMLFACNNPTKLMHPTRINLEVKLSGRLRLSRQDHVQIEPLWGIFILIGGGVEGIWGCNGLKEMSYQCGKTSLLQTATAYGFRRFPKLGKKGIHRQLSSKGVCIRRV